ncbi:hypothetical protein NDI56_04045 [Haloarcula sp. S1CR25-12]|uniref:Halobacterial output domain-containing protein n=1 Tax=Haloarcula saliterrae TaxID=2950534 RepID=A0ABU2F8J0_9EURY|nr:hypothetical protein [Haloarcula sp. S1CR25-12]MDS0258582.1 hypothetical protein [Haloarcula sp. S1CR25-12]
MSVQPPAPATVPVETLQGNRREATVVDEFVEADADGFDRVFRVDVDGVTMRVNEDNIPETHR